MEFATKKKIIIKEIEALEDENTLRVIQKILDIEDDDIPQWQKDVLDERWEAYKKNPEKAVSWEVMKKEIELKYGYKS